MKDKKKKNDFEALVAELAKGVSSGQSLTGKDGVFTPLLKRVIEASLEGEIEAHLKAREVPARHFECFILKR